MIWVVIPTPSTSLRINSWRDPFLYVTEGFLDPPAGGLGITVRKSCFCCKNLLKLGKWWMKDAFMNSNAINTLHILLAHLPLKCLEIIRNS